MRVLVLVLSFWMGWNKGLKPIFWNGRRRIRAPVSQQTVLEVVGILTTDALRPQAWRQPLISYLATAWLTEQTNIQYRSIKRIIYSYHLVIVYA